MSDEISPRNKLNDLTNKEFLRETKSFWLSRAEQLPTPVAETLEQFVDWILQSREPDEAEQILEQLDRSFVLSKTPPRSKLKSLHPATFSELDVERLIRFFSKQGECVLDPFLGSGSTLIACANCGRNGVGVELSQDWAQIARRRIDEEATGRLLSDYDVDLQVIAGDAKDALDGLQENSVDFVVTSPPYWSILTKKAGMKAKAERTDKGLATKYSDDERDLGNIQSYERFLDELAAVLCKCGRVLKPKRYMAVIVSDFRHGPKFYLLHSDLAGRIEEAGLPLKGVTILAQDNKNLYPFGVPHAFVSNIHHQYILAFQKPAED